MQAKPTPRDSDFSSLYNDFGVMANLGQGFGTALQVHYLAGFWQNEFLQQTIMKFWHHCITRMARIDMTSLAI
jgi:hypothetical protein